jgi:glucose/arabinose dehydrogenase
LKARFKFVSYLWGRAAAGRVQPRAAILRLAAAAAVMQLAGACWAQQLVNDPIIQANFTGISPIGSGIGNITQMTFGPDGRLYVATFTEGIKRYDYSPTGGLTNGTTVWSRPNDFAGGQFNGSLGIAFHQDPLLGSVMYIAPAVSSSFDPTLNRVQSIIRLTDSDHDGLWGETAAGEVNQAIVDNLRVTDLHQVNHLLVRGNTLYAGIGSRTRTGGERSEYGGGPNPDDGEFSYTGSINWIRDLTRLSADATTPNLAGFTIEPHTSTLPFTSTDPGKLTVYSTGFRNVFGLATDADGQLWVTMNQNEDPLKPDELHRSNFKDDHRFPKFNEVSGDWKQNSAALEAGYFQTFKDPVATLGDHASADGIDFTYVNSAFAGHPFIVRFAGGLKDLVAVDPDTGAVRRVVTGFNNPLDVLTDPAGNLLVGAYGGAGQIFRVSLAPGLGLVFGDLDGNGLIDAQDWATQRDNFNADLAGLSLLDAYGRGDLNSDLKNDALDFALFKTAFDDRNGAGAFATMLKAPEPGAATLAAAAVAMVLATARRRRSGQVASSLHHLS